MGKLKYFLYILCGIFSFSLISCHDTFAIDIDLSQGGAFQFTGSSYVKESNGTERICPISYDKSGGIPSLKCTAYNHVALVNLSLDKTLPKGSVVTLYFDVVVPGLGAFTNDMFPTYPIEKNANREYGYTIVSIDRGLSSDYESTQVPSSNKTTISEQQYYYSVTLLLFEDTTNIWLALTDGQVGTAEKILNFVPGHFFVIKDTSMTQEDIKDQLKQDSEDQKNRWDKEDEQRDEDKQASEDASNNSQSSSDDSQKQADDASKNLFQVLTEFVSAISGASASSCSITGDFGFFNVGSIDLCTGASKVQPITTVIGTVMLIGLCIPAVVTLLHRFVSLYNEVMS